MRRRRTGVVASETCSSSTLPLAGPPDGGLAGRRGRM